MDSPKFALKEANICFIFTEWKQIKSLEAKQYKELMQTPLVYDGRNLYSPADMEQDGVEYYGIGRRRRQK